jgi:hypothetical protein
MAAYSDYGDHRIHIDWKLNKRLGYEFKRVRCKHNGRWNNYGEIRKVEGEITYWANRRSDQVCLEYMGWALDHSTLVKLTSYGVQFLGVEDELGRTWRIPFSTFDFLDLPNSKGTPIAQAKAKTYGIEWIDWSDHKGKRPGAAGCYGARQWVIPFKVWTEYTPSTKELFKLISIKSPRARVSQS